MDDCLREREAAPSPQVESAELRPDSLEIVIGASGKGGVVRKASFRTEDKRRMGQKSPAFSIDTSIERDLSSLLASLPMALLGIDSAGRIRFWSKGCQEAFNGLSKQDFGQTVEIVLGRMARRYHAPGLEGLAALIRSALPEGTSTSGWQFEILSNGHSRRIQADFSPLRLSPDGGGGGVLILQDVTARQRLEEGTREVSHLASLGQLAACIAHEVRNPLSAVKAAAQFLAQENSGNGLVTHYAEIISREASRLDRLVGDFLLYARPPALECLPISIEELLKSCHGLLEREAAAKGILLDCRRRRSLPVVFGDSEALLQALLNLAKNSLEATPPGGKVGLSARCENDKDRVEIIIRDTGSGISRKDMERIFAPFFTTKPSGTGLGLPIARRIIELQGGSLSLMSRSGRGTRARVLLPVSRSEDGNR
jgi:signal transduction histidine kinase